MNETQVTVHPRTNCSPDVNKLAKSNMLCVFNVRWWNRNQIGVTTPKGRSKKEERDIGSKEI
jgi:hypothetical protein